MVSQIGIIGLDGALKFFRREGAGFIEVSKPASAGPRGRDLIVFVPPVDVSVHRVSIPAKTERDARRAAPFSIEDDLAQSPDDVHIALAPVGPDQLRTVLAVDAGLMTEWIDTLEKNGIGDAALVAPQSLLPESDVVVQTGEAVFGRVGGRVFAIDAQPPGDLITGLTQGGEGVLEFDFRNDVASFAEQLAEWQNGGAGVSLRQGAFGVRRPVDMARIKRWRLAAALAAAFGVAWIGSQIWSVQNTRALTASLEARAIDVVQAGWPDLNGNVELALNEVRAQGAGGGVVFPSALTATAALYDAVGKIEGSELRSMRYDRTRGQVLAIVAYPDFGDGERLARSFDETGLRARVGDARQSGRQVIAELVLEVGS